MNVTEAIEELAGKVSDLTMAYAEPLDQAQHLEHAMHAIRTLQVAIAAERSRAIRDLVAIHGVTGAAAELGMSRQRVHKLIKFPDLEPHGGLEDQR